MSKPSSHWVIVAFATLMFFGGGCAAPVYRAHLSDLSDLPRSKGSYGGSIVPGPVWLYFGSDARYHYFRYRYTNDNFVYTRRLKVPHGELSLNFEQPFQSYEAPAKEVVPLCELGTRISGFSIGLKLDSADQEWSRHAKPILTFE